METKKRKYRFAALSLDGKETEETIRTCKRPFTTNNYRLLIHKLNNKKIKAVIVQPLNY
jgi:hypothetical protein